MYIYGEKIVLRAVEEYDNSMLLSLINDPETEIMLCGSSWPVSEVEQKKWFNEINQKMDTFRSIVALKEDGTAVGTLILSDIDPKNGTAQIHIKMDKKEGRRKGYGTDAIKTIIQYAFNELRLNCIYANILSHNKASIRLFEKCGFLREGVLRDRVYKGGVYLNVFSYSILRGEDEWNKK